MKPDTMSTCRIERKRAHDREAQRASRAKTKAYIAHLEKTVADLSGNSGDDRTNYLAQHSTKQAHEIENLQGLVSKIRTLITDSTKGEQQQQQQQPNSPEAVDSPQCKAESPRPADLAQVCAAIAVDTSAALLEAEESQSNGTRSSSESPSSEDRFSAEIPRSTIPAAPSSSPVSVVSPTRTLVVLGESMHCEDSDDLSFFSRLNRCIEKVEATPDHLSTLHVDEDIMVRAIVHGWDAAERLHHFDIVWRFLRAFDEGLWQPHAHGPLERLAHFWQMRSTLLHKICPRNQPRRATPTFMNPTLQQMVAQPHNLVADYYCWPRVRDRVIEQGIRGTSGRASIAFTKAFRFDWPYEVRDAYMHNTTTGMYELSGAFVVRFNDLASYCLVPPKPRNIATCAPHPALACADHAPQEEPIRPWKSSSSDAKEDSASSTSSTSSSTQEKFCVRPEPMPLLAEVSAAGGKEAAGWMPSFSMDISSEAAFMEFAMEAWPAL